MVATHNLGVYLGFCHLGGEALGDEEVVDAPPSVLLTGAEAVGPPAVGHLVGVQTAEGVDKATVEQTGHGLALLVGKSGVAAVGLGILEVYLLVGHIHVATDDDGLVGVEAEQIVLEVALPLHAVVQTAQLVL